jgi:hypothetical protein
MVSYSLNDVNGTRQRFSTELAQLFSEHDWLKGEIAGRRRLHGRVRLTNHDRWFFIQLYRWFPAILRVLTIMRPA